MKVRATTFPRSSLRESRLAVLGRQAQLRRRPPPRQALTLSGGRAECGRNPDDHCQHHEHLNAPPMSPVHIASLPSRVLLGCPSLSSPSSPRRPEALHLQSPTGRVEHWRAHVRERVSLCALAMARWVHRMIVLLLTFLGTSRQRLAPAGGVMWSVDARATPVSHTRLDRSATPARRLLSPAIGPRLAQACSSKRPWHATAGRPPAPELVG
jgi:hypothetical protein